MIDLAAQRPALVRSLPFVAFIAALALRGAVGGNADTRWLYGAQAGIAALALWMLWHHYTELRGGRASALHLPRGLESLVVGLAVFGLWIVLDEPWMRTGQPTVSFVPLDAEGRLQWGLIALRMVGAVLVVPVMEELFWRSFLMRWLDRRDFLSLPPAQTSLFAWISSSAVFALAHEQWLAGLMAGLVFGALYRRSGQIWHAISAHGVANLALGLWVVHQRAWGFW